MEQTRTGPSEQERRNPLSMHDLLVRDGDDVAGLLAFALHEKHRADWARSFQESEGRKPSESEIAALLLGERLPQRLQAYHDAAAALLARSQASAAPSEASKPPAAQSAPELAAPTARSEAAEALRSGKAWRAIALMCGLVLVMAVAFQLAASWLFQ